MSNIAKKTVAGFVVRLDLDSWGYCVNVNHMRPHLYAETKYYKTEMAARVIYNHIKSGTNINQLIAEYTLTVKR